MIKSTPLGFSVNLTFIRSWVRQAWICDSENILIKIASRKERKSSKIHIRLLCLDLAVWQTLNLFDFQMKCWVVSLQQWNAVVLTYFTSNSTHQIQVDGLGRTWDYLYKMFLQLLKYGDQTALSKIPGI